jgi:hypothetical protein
MGFLRLQLKGHRDGLMGNSGPQKYTGKSMADSHAHLKITAEEWETFLDYFQQTLNKFTVPVEEQAVREHQEDRCEKPPGNRSLLGTLCVLDQSYEPDQKDLEEAGFVRDIALTSYWVRLAWGKTCSQRLALQFRSLTCLKAAA